MYRVLWCALGVGDRGTKKLTSLNAFVWGMATRGVCVRLLLSLCTLLLSLSLSRSLSRSLYRSLFLPLSLARSRARSLSIVLSLTHSLTHSRAHTQPLPPSLTHTHTNTHTILPLSTEHADTCRHVTVGASALRFSFLFSDGVPARRGARGHFDCGRRHRRRG
jgi:hypothetical protein